MISLLTRLSALSPEASLRTLWKHRELVANLLRREIAAQFKGTVLGVAWAFARPVLVLAVYTFVFGVIWRRDGDGMPLGAFAMTMFCGMVLYSIFSASVNWSCNSVVNRSSLVKQVVFPLETLPLVLVMTQFSLGASWFLVLYAGVFFVFGHLPSTCLLLPVVLLPLFLITCGLAWFLSALSVYVRDLKQFVPVVLQVLFFMTPIFWQLDMLQGTRVRFVPYLYLNPLTGLVESLRDILIRGQLPDWRMLGILTTVGLAVWYFGFAWFFKTRKGFADVI